MTHFFQKVGRRRHLILFFLLFYTFTNSIEVNQFFKETSFPSTNISISLNPEALVHQIDEVLDYFRKYKKQDPAAVNTGIFSQLGITLSDVETTLRFLKNIINEDLESGTGFRLQDPQFLKKHFRVLRWYPYPRGEKIRITKYAVFTIKGSHKKNSIYKYALYRLPDDEKGMSLKEAEKQKHRLSRFKYTKQQVLAGTYDKGGAKPLVWVTRQGLEETLMGGSICIELPGGEKKYFNVDRNNGIPYDPKIKNPWDQKRYWYFGEVQKPQGYGMDIQSQMRIFPGAVFAGDVYNLGLGKLMGIFYKDRNGKQEMRIGLLADTGGAFTPNLNQLDYYAGVFNTRAQFNRKIQALPAFAEVYLFIKRKPALKLATKAQRHKGK